MKDHTINRLGGVLNSFLLPTGGKEKIENNIISRATGQRVKEGYGDNAKERFTVNISDIETKLIQNTGRFVEHYASDLFITMMSLYEYLENVEQAMLGRKVFWFGLRESGVDGEGFLINRVGEYPEYTYHEHYYRRIYAVVVEADDEYEDNISVTLMNGRSAVDELIRYVKSHREELD